MSKPWTHPKLGEFEVNGPGWLRTVNVPAFKAFSYDTGYPNARRSRGTYPLFLLWLGSEPPATPVCGPGPGSGSWLHEQERERASSHSVGAPATGPGIGDWPARSRGKATCSVFPMTNGLPGRRGHAAAGSVGAY